MSEINKSGVTPLSYKVLIKVHKKEEKTKGGIIIPEEVLERESAASQVATIADMGSAAFTVGVGDLENEWDKKPAVGDEVIINKYAGIIIEGNDGEEYRIINDKEILAIKQ